VPELPDITVYIERLDVLLRGQVLQRVRLGSPFLLRSVEPPLSATHGAVVRGFHSIGKRIVFELEGPGGGALFLVLHLMIAGRLRWRKVGAKLPGKLGLCAFDFDPGTLILTEASKKKRASLHVVGSRAGLAEFDRGGIDPLSADDGRYAEALRRENHTLKRSLTDPRLFSGIGNAYSDEILHRARLSPVTLTSRLSDDEITRLRAATVEVLRLWTERLRAEAGEFPEKVTAFRDGMAAHGRFGQPCPDCGQPIQRIRYADNETNYCAGCQNGGRLLADRAISRLLKKDWPRTLDALEDLRARMRDGGK
jgi:formamidopyrimidine-DNA glycosylase